MTDEIKARLKQEIIASANLLVKSGVISLSLHGNYSARIPDTDTFLLTAGGSICRAEA